MKCRKRRPCGAAGWGTASKGSSIKDARRLAIHCLLAMRAPDLRSSKPGGAAKEKKGKLHLKSSSFPFTYKK